MIGAAYEIEECPIAQGFVREVELEWLRKMIAKEKEWDRKNRLRILSEESEKPREVAASLDPTYFP